MVSPSLSSLPQGERLGLASVSPLSFRPTFLCAMGYAKSLLNSPIEGEVRHEAKLDILPLVDPAIAVGLAGQREEHELGDPGVLLQTETGGIMYDQQRLGAS